MSSLQGFASPPVRLDLIDLALDRTAAAPAQPIAPAAVPQPVSVPADGSCPPATRQAEEPPGKLHSKKQGAKVAALSRPASLKNAIKALDGLAADGASFMELTDRPKDKKGSKRHTKHLEVRPNTPANGLDGHLLDSESEAGPAGRVADPASSTNSQPACLPDAASVLPPSSAAPLSDLPPTGNHAKKPARAKHKATSESNLKPTRKRQKTSVAPDMADVEPPGAGSLSLALEGHPTAESDVSSSSRQTGRADGNGKLAKAGKPRKNMSLNAASLDTSLDKSPLQATRPTRLKQESDEEAEGMQAEDHPGAKDTSLPASILAAAHDSQPAHADSDQLLLQPSAGLDRTDPEGLADLNKQQRSAAAVVKPAANANGSKAPLLSKRYGSTFIWGQLSGWFKQTVYDPTASLSAERRGTISLPDIESCYGASKQRYNAKVGLGTLQVEDVISYLDFNQASTHLPPVLWLPCAWFKCCSLLLKPAHGSLSPGMPVQPAAWQSMHGSFITIIVDAIVCRAVAGSRSQAAANTGMTLVAWNLSCMVLGPAAALIALMPLQEREDLLEHIEKRPDAMWKSSMWSFRNDAKVYGSPMHDAVWSSITGQAPEINLEEMLSHLQAAALPFAP